jgi:putative endonuclease
LAYDLQFRAKMATTTETGRETERAAIRYISAKRPIRVLASNFRSRRGELDLVFEETRPNGATELVFLEIRHRRAGGLLDGVESVGPVKRLRLIHASRLFLARYRGPASGVRYDILSWDGYGWEHVEDAWSG